jgi:hypothetical protein
MACSTSCGLVPVARHARTLRRMEFSLRSLLATHDGQPICPNDVIHIRVVGVRPTVASIAKVNVKRNEIQCDGIPVQLPLASC